MVKGQLWFRIFFISGILLLCTGTARSQWLKKLFLPGPHDSAYITTFPDDITGRFLSTTKNNQFRLFDSQVEDALIYKPNNRLMTGVGVQYGILGFNVGFALPWNRENHDDHIYGKTERLDFQTHLFFRSFIIDLYYMNYKGFYLENSMIIEDWPDPEAYLIRGDVRLVSYGGSFHYFFNKRKFSYKAVFNQNEWQRKSAGSFILGGGIYFIPITADSSLIPGNLVHESFFGDIHFNEADMMTVGPTAGYTHTFVLWKKWFINLSLVAGITAGYTRLEGQANNFSHHTGFTWHFQNTFRMGLGYNSDRWFVGIGYMNAAVRNQVGIPEAWLQFDAGNFQFTVARRFNLKKPFKWLRPEYW